MSAAATTRVHILVTGRVQGVGFRAFVAATGQALGLTGWVRNVGDTQVETVAEGARERVDKFVQAVRAGPRAARVDEARVEWEPATGEFPNFDVRRSL